MASSAPAGSASSRARASRSSATRWSIRDVVPEKIDALRRGEVPFHEERVPELLQANAERLTYTLDVDDVADCEFLFVCVDTPPTYSGDADLSRVWTVIDELPELDGRPVLVMKSTVPVGTGEKVRAGLDQRGLDHVGYVSNPEFLAEGRAVRDFMKPDRIAIGAFHDGRRRRRRRRSTRRSTRRSCGRTSTPPR